MHAVIALAKKDLKLLLRDRVGFFFTFFFPLIYAVFFGAIFSGDGGDSAEIGIMVVDEDESEASRTFIKELDEAAELAVTIANRDEAVSQVRKGDRTGYIVLTRGFGEAQDRMFWGDPMRIEIGVDPSRSAEAGMLEGIITKHAMEGFQEAFANPHVMRKKSQAAIADMSSDESMNPVARAVLQRFFSELDAFMEKVPTLGAADPSGASAKSAESSGWQPVVIQKVDVARAREGPENSYEISFPQAITWGVLGCAAAFGISMVIERTQGTLVRLCMAPISRPQILAGKAIACFITTVTMVCALLAFGIVVFKIRPQSILFLAMSVLSVASCFVGIMMLLSVLGKSEQSAGGIGWAVLLVMAMLGGGMIPLFVMPAWMRQVSNVSPVKWAILSMEGAIWRSFSLSEMLLPCGVLIGVGAISFYVGARAFRWNWG